VSTLVAATATGAALLWLAGYAIACTVWPFAPCRKCEGSGRRKSPSGRAFRLCTRCKATGRRIRTGRRIFNYLRILNKEGAR
jgi:hypothetical protein